MVRKQVSSLNVDKIINWGGRRRGPRVTRMRLRATMVNPIKSRSIALAASLQNQIGCKAGLIHGITKGMLPGA